MRPGHRLDVKTTCLYSLGMGSRLLNVRLSPEDERLVERLRARGISISDLMRRALRSAAAQAAQEPVDAGAVVDELIARFPTVPNASRARVEATDRRAVREHIVKRLRRQR